MTALEAEGLEHGRALADVERLTWELGQERRMVRALRARVEGLVIQHAETHADLETVALLLREQLEAERALHREALARAGELAAEVLVLRRRLRERELLASGPRGVGPGIVTGSAP